MQFSWTAPSDAAEAIAIQQALRSRVVLSNDHGALKTIVGIDVGYDPARNISHAAIVRMEMEDLRPIESIRAELPTEFPYIPGLLSFREIPVILSALGKLQSPPDLLMVDGQGIAHPRRLGIAAHLGVLLDLPAVGIAKSRLTGAYHPPAEAKGSQSPLTDKGERIGTVLRSKQGCLPLFISPGHRMDQETAVALALRCLTRYRLPEPTRLADKLSKTKGKAPLLA